MKAECLYLLCIDLLQDEYYPFIKTGSSNCWIAIISAVLAVERVVTISNCNCLLSTIKYVSRFPCSFCATSRSFTLTALDIKTILPCKSIKDHAEVQRKI